MLDDWHHVVPRVAERGAVVGEPAALTKTRKFYTATLALAAGRAAVYMYMYVTL